MAATKTRSRSSKTRSSSSRGGGRTNGNSSEADRYRRAAEDALQQLDWAIGYLHGIRKTDISKALAKNRSFIRRNLMGQPEEALPTEKTDET